MRSTVATLLLFCIKIQTSIAPTPRGPGDISLTDRKLAELLAKQKQLEEQSLSSTAGGSSSSGSGSGASAAFDRALSITLPNTSSSSASISAAAAASSSSAAAGVDDDREDRALVAQRVAKQTAERRRAEEVPFQTRAMREVERLQKARVYSHALIRVQLPDRYTSAVLHVIVLYTITCNDCCAMCSDCCANSSVSSKQC
jgi:hypothetical protein